MSDTVTMPSSLARAALDALRDLIRESRDPGTGTLAVEWHLSHLLGETSGAGLPPMKAWALMLEACEVGGRDALSGVFATEAAAKAFAQEDTDRSRIENRRPTAPLAWRKDGGVQRADRGAFVTATEAYRAWDEASDHLVQLGKAKAKALDAYEDLVRAVDAQRARCAAAKAVWEEAERRERGPGPITGGRHA